MRLMLFKSLMAACALSLAVPGLAATGNAGSGGIPGVQETLESGEFEITPDKRVYTEMFDDSSYGHVGMVSGYLTVDGSDVTANQFIRIQFENATEEDKATVIIRINEEVRKEMDSENGVWLTSEDYNFGTLSNNEGRCQIDYLISCSTEKTLSYSVGLYDSQDLESTPLYFWEGEICIMEKANYPGLKQIQIRLSGSLDDQYPFNIGVEANAFTGKAAMLRFDPSILEEGKDAFTITGEGVSKDENGYYICNIASLESKDYPFTLQATGNCKGELKVYLCDADGYEISERRITLNIPIPIYEGDKVALEQMAKDNPDSEDLQEFISSGNYLKDRSESGDSDYNVGVTWSQDDPSRVEYFRLTDYENKVTTLNLSPLTGLKNIYIDGTRLETLDLSTLTELSNLSLYNTTLTWKDVTLPSRNLGYIAGATLVTGEGMVPEGDGDFYALTGTMIDLSDYAKIGTVASTYLWWERDRTTNETNVVDMSLATDKDGNEIPGAFIFEGEPGKYYWCEISNTQYIDWKLRTQEIRADIDHSKYSQAEVDALKKLASENNHITDLQTFIDAEGWTLDNWNTDQFVVGTQWALNDEDQKYHLTHLRIEPNWQGESIHTLDISAFTELEYFECTQSLDVSELDLSQNTKLEELHIFSNSLKSLDASNCTKLRIFEWDNTGSNSEVQLSEINLSNCTELETFKIIEAPIETFDFSPFTKLRELSIGRCPNLAPSVLNDAPTSLQILSLSLSTQFQDYINNLPSNIISLDLNHTSYTLPPKSETLLTLGVSESTQEIDLANFPALEILDIGDSGTDVLKYSQIRNYRPDITYTGRSCYQIESTTSGWITSPWTAWLENGDTIDLSSEAFIKDQYNNDVETKYVWRSSGEDASKHFITIAPGVFILDSKKQQGDLLDNTSSYSCYILNPLFCDTIPYGSDDRYRGFYMSCATIQLQHKPKVFDPDDVAVLEKIVNDSNNGSLQEWWDSEAWKTGENSGFAQAVWNDENPSRLTELYLYYMYENFAESVDLRDLDRLEILSLASNNVSEVILPNEKGNLRSLMLPYTKVNSLIVSPYTALEYLDVTQTPLQALDLSNNTNLTELFLNYTAVEGIETTAVTENLVSYGLPSTATSIDLRKFPNLKHFNPSGTTMRFSDVKNPRQMEETYASTTYYTGTSDREGLSTYGSTLSFPDEMTVSGQPSSITWSALDGFDLTDISINASGNSYTIADDVPPRASISAQITNTMFRGWTLYIQTTVYTCDGDANLDRTVNVADITATTSYILGDIENMIDRFGDNEADVNYDDYINVADITGIVNIIQGKPVTKASTLRDAYQPTVLLELDDKGFLTMTSQVPVAGIQLELAGATAELPLLGEAAHLTQASTLNGDTLRTLGYSMDGKTIPAGKTVIMQLPAGVKLLKAAFSDAEATSLKAEGDILPTAIETIQTADQAEAVRNYPNPFSGSTTFSYTLKEPSTKVAIQIFSTSGAQVETLEGLPGNAGLNRYTTGIQLPGGIYYYRLLLDGKAAGEANTMMIK